MPWWPHLHYYLLSSNKTPKQSDALISLSNRSLKKGASPKFIMYPHLVLLNWKGLTISLSVNMLRKSLFKAKHDLREKWLDTTLKKHKNFAIKVLTGITILSIVLLHIWLYLLAGSLSLAWAFPVFDFPKNTAPIFELREIWIS